MLKFTSIVGYTSCGPTYIERFLTIFGQCINVLNYNLYYASAYASIQRRAVRFFLNDYSRNSSASAMVADLNWQSLEERHIINNLTMFYKINSDFVNTFFPAEISLGFQGD